MEISFVILICTLLTVVGVASMIITLRNKRLSMIMSALHALLTLAVFGVFTGYIVDEIPSGTLTLPRISYMFYAIAGIAAIVSIVVNKMLSVKLPKWVSLSYGTFELLGYATLWVTAISFMY